MQNQGCSWPDLLSSSVKTLDQSSTLTCHPLLLEPYEAWLGIQRSQTNLPPDTLAMLQQSTPIPVVETQQTNGQKSLYFVGGFIWASELQLSKPTVTRLKKTHVQELRSGSVVEQFLLEQSWCEVIDLIRNGIDRKAGVVQWQWALNELMPQHLLQQTLGVSKVTARLVGEILGVPASRIHQLKEQYKPPTRKQRPSASTLLKRLQK